MPDRSGSSTAVPMTGVTGAGGMGAAAAAGTTSASSGGSILRRIVGSNPAARVQPIGDGAWTTADPRMEAELAERLDTVLGIAGRLAASHDRSELFRMIVDETKRALRVDATAIRILHDEQLAVAAWAGIGGRRRAATPRLSP